MGAAAFCRRHRKRSADFTRERKLGFATVVQVLLSRSVKSLQLILNEWGARLDRRITASAFSQARSKLAYTAFIELLEKVVIDTIYSDGDYEKFRGHRLLAIDGSSLRVPNTAESRKHFGYVAHLNGEGSSVGGQVEAKMTVVYDVLNAIPLSGKLDQGRVGDHRAAEQHFEILRPGDLLLADRGFVSYRFFAGVLSRKCDFVVRCKDGIYRHQHGLAADDADGDVTVALMRPSKTDDHLPDKLAVRFVQLRLPNGEIEVLATSLLDKQRYPRKLFQKLYYRRWKIETYFQTLKSRLCIDNFTGKSVEAIHQDFYATLFVSGLETLLTGEANEVLSEKTLKHSQKVNKAVSFHVIKNNVVRLILENPPDIQEQITALFQSAPTSVRPNREKPPRRNLKVGANRRSLYFQRYARKHVF